MDSAGRQLHDIRQGLPLSVPTAQAAFILLHHRREQTTDESGNADRCLQHHRGTHWIALVRHSGRAAAAFAGGLKYFRDFGLHVQRKIPGNFSYRSGAQA